MRYEYFCDSCKRKWEETRTVDDRDFPTVFPCTKCGEYAVIRLISSPMIKIPEGGCGNAANGYSSTHGDAENFKARDKGEAIPYPMKKRKI